MENNYVKNIENSIKSVEDKINTIESKEKITKRIKKSKIKKGMN